MTEEKKTAEHEKKQDSSAKPETSGEPAKQSEKSKASEKKENKKGAGTAKKPALSRKEIDKLILEHADMKARIREYQDNYLLLAAEFENFKKRSLKDQQRSQELYRERLLGELLPVVDDVDRAVQHHKNDEYADAFAMIKSKLLSYLEKYGVLPFDSAGEEFDPDRHDAMLTRKEEDKANNIVLEEFQKGYMIGNKVLRHAKVVVNIIDE